MVTPDRRAFLTAATSLAVAGMSEGQSAPPGAAGMSDWASWTSAFLSPEGRVADAGQGGASHSEGQAYALLLAVAFRDREVAERVVAWTEAHLAVRRDPLLAWKWSPSDDGQMEDYNNASDGDLLYAWALLRAARAFQRTDFAARAREMSQAIVSVLLVTDPSSSARVLLLPAAEGFRIGGGVVVNPSYLMPLALHELGAAFDLPRLPAAAEGMADLLWEVAATGLVPDWLAVTRTGGRPADGFEPQFGYEAIRVPLYLVWSRRPGHPAVTGARAAWMRGLRGTSMPVRMSLDGEVLETSDAPGYRAVAALTAASGDPAERMAAPRFSADQPYYPAALQMLAAVAAMEIGRPPPL